jgi:hypothetical protein
MYNYWKSEIPEVLEVESVWSDLCSDERGLQRKNFRRDDEVSVGRIKVGIDSVSNSWSPSSKNKQKMFMSYLKKYSLLKSEI